MVNRFRHAGIRAAVASAVLAALASTGCDPSESERNDPAQKTSLKATEFTSDPILTVAHGVALLPDGKGIEPDDEFRLGAQRYYLKRLQAEADSATRADYASFERSYRKQNGSASEIAINAGLLEWLLERVMPRDRAKLSSISAYLAQRVAPVDSDAQERGSNQHAFINPVARSGTDYTDQCRAAGVPIPPEWREEGGQWTLRGELSTVLISRDLDAFVYSYEPPDKSGICFALPRYAQDPDKRDGKPYNAQDIILLGVICQGNATSKACFWDNARVIKRGEKLKIALERDAALMASGTMPGQGSPRAAAAFNGGGDLYGKSGGICTECHRGENAFIIHTDKSLPMDFDDTLKMGKPELSPLYRRAAALKAKGWVDPMVHSLWPQNRRPMKQLAAFVKPAGVDSETQEEESSCNDCHNKQNGWRFGEIGVEYCRSVLLASVKGGARGGRIMPPSSTGKHPDHYKSFIAELQSACDAGAPLLGIGFDTPQSLGVFADTESALITGDVNGDGRADLVRIAEPDEVSVALSPLKATTRFERRGTVPVGPNHRYQIGDFDGDGDGDLVIAMATGSINVATFDRGKFGPAFAWSSGGTAVDHVVVGDFDNDRKDDVMTFSGDGVRLHRSLAGIFDTSARLDIGYIRGAHVPVAGYVDGDSNADVLLLPTRERAASVLATSDLFEIGKFARKDGPDVVLGAKTIARMEDVDGDGYSDLVTIDASDVTVTLRTGPEAAEQPGWEDPKRSASNGAVDAHVLDVDGDGRADLVTIAADGKARLSKSYAPSSLDPIERGDGNPGLGVP